MAENLQLLRRGDLSRIARENGSPFQSLRALHRGTRRHAKCRGPGRGRKGVSNARGVQQTAIQKASGTSVNSCPAEGVWSDSGRNGSATCLLSIYIHSFRLPYLSL